eukprot:Trichotokara_eunicae@DN3731_c0_g1_i1.p1
MVEEKKGSKRLIRPSRVVLVLQGRFAGKKGIVLNTFDNGTKTRRFPHALVAGVAKPPGRITKRTKKKAIIRKSKFTVFVKFVNYVHLLPTRYSASTIDVKALVGQVDLSDAHEKEKARMMIKKVLEEKFMNPKSDKGDKVAKELVFLRQKHRF